MHTLFSVGFVGLLTAALAAQRPVQVYEVKAAPFEDRSLLQGDVLPLESSRAIPRVTGYVKKIHVAEGDLVGENALLVTVDCPDLVCEQQVTEAKVKQAEAMRDVAHHAIATATETRNVATADHLAAASAGTVAQVAVELAEADLKRVKNLHGENAATDEEFEQAELALRRTRASLAVADSNTRAKSARVQKTVANIALAEAELSKAEAGVALARAQAARAGVFIDFCALRNPYARARVTLQLKDAGAMALADETPILEIMNVARVRIRFGLPLREAMFVRAGTPVTITGLGHPTQQAKVTRVTGSLSTTSRTMAAEVVLDNQDQEWLPGTLANVDVLVQKLESGIVIPARALIKDQTGRPFVWLAAGAKAKRVEVRLGADRGRDVQILSGLSPGDLVIVAGLIGLGEGDAVVTEKVGK